MFRQLESIWDKFKWEPKRTKLMDLCGWSANDKNYDKIEKMYKDHILLKQEFSHGISGHLIIFNLYLADDIDDPEPILIYYCYDPHNASYGTPPNGWVNIGPWSIYAKNIIEDTVNIINNYIKIQEFEEYVDEEKEFTCNIKPHLQNYINETIFKLDGNKLVELSESIMCNKDFNEYTREKDKKDAEIVMKKLAGDE